MPQRPPTRASSPAETLNNLNMGVNLYTDPTLCAWRMWYSSSNVYSGAFGYIQRARFATIVTNSTGLPYTTFKYFAIPTGGNYLLGDVNGKLYSYDSGSSYAATQRLNPYVDPAGTGSALLDGPWSREILGNIVYEMNGQVKQSGRNANATIIEAFGIDTPDSNPQVALTSGGSSSIASIQRTGNVVTANVGASGVYTAGVAINISGVSDPSFNGTFILTGYSSITHNATWNQLGQDTSAILSSGTASDEITKSVGRSYAWAWENANTTHVSAPSPSTEYFALAGQYATIQCIEAGTAAVSGTTVTGTNTSFSTAWVGRSLWLSGFGAMGRILTVASPTSMTIDTSHGATTSNIFNVYDPQCTNVRLYATADGGSTYYRIARNTFIPTNGSINAAGLQFLDTANSEPPSIPFTTETSQLYNQPPPVGAFIKEYQGVLLVYGVEGSPQTFFYSNQTLTTTGLQQQSFAPLNQITLPIQNAAINGMAEFPGALIIWSSKQDMFRLTGLLSDNTSATATQQGSTVAALPYNLGCASPFAVALTPLGAIWLTPNAEIWLFTDSYAPRNIGRSVQTLLQSIPPTQLSQARATYYHTFNRNWFILTVPVNGAANCNKALILDLDLLASNGSPSFFVFDMASNQPAWFQFDVDCPSIEVMYETSELVRLFVGGTNVIQDIDFQSGFGTETSVTGSVLLHAFGNDSPQVLKRPTWLRFNTNQDPSQLAIQGWQFQALGIDDDYYTFPFPLSLTLTPGTNDSMTLGGNPTLAPYGSPFRTSQEMFRIGGVNFVQGRRLQFGVTFPTAPGANYQLRQIQLGFGPSPPR